MRETGEGEVRESREKEGEVRERGWRRDGRMTYLGREDGVVRAEVRQLLKEGERRGAGRCENIACGARRG